MKRLAYLFAILALIFSLTSCGGDSQNTDKGDPSNPSEDTGESPESPNEKKDITGVSFTDCSYTYDGKEKSVSVTGTVPDGVVVEYSNANGTNAGTYNATATLSGEGYNTLVLNAKLTINKATITANITFSDTTVEYDAKLHSIQLIGNVPAGATVSYTYNGQSVGGVSQVGKYTVVATISGQNYITAEYTATLTIKSTEEQLYLINYDDVVYFQNNLDGNKLYKVENGVLSKVNNDTPEFFFTDGNALYYYSTSLFSKTIRKIQGNNVSTVYSVSGEYITCDSEYLYYSVNKLLGGSENGIYRINLNGEDDAPTRIATTKAAYLTIIGDYLYYSNLSDGKKLYKIPVTGGTPSLVHNEAVKYIIADGSILYFDSSKTTASAIYKYNTSSGALTKLTNDSGKYLAKVGNDIYYVNNDLLTSNLFGDGIYKISVLGGVVGTKIIEAADGDGYSSLMSDGTYLYYYKLSDKHLYKYDPSTSRETDLMDGFVPPVENVIPSGDCVIAEYNGEIYYTNNRDGGLNGACIYKFNPQTKAHVKVLADHVAGVWFNGDYMYYSTCVITNYALHRMDMKTGESVKINSDRCENLIFDGDTIYYVKVSTIQNNAIMRLNSKNLSAEAELVYNGQNVSVTGMYLVDGTFYFISNPAIGYQYIYTYTIGENNSGVSLKIKAKHLVISDNTIYYYDGTSNSIKSCSIDGSNVKTIKSSVEINDMYADGKKIYFASTSKSATGLFVYNSTSGGVSTISTSVADGVTVIDGKVWFIDTAVNYVADYPTHSGNGNAYLYCYEGNSVTKK